MLKALIIALTTSYTAWFLANFETRVIYPFDPQYSAPDDAGEARLAESQFTTSDGENLILWSYPAPGDGPTVLYFPGNSGTLADRAARFSRLIDQGYGVVAMAYRGSSGSTGRPNERDLTADAQMIAAQLTPDGPLVLYGESLGTAVAIKLAAEGIGDGLVLEAPFLSIPDLVMAQFPNEDLAGLLTQIWDSKSTITAVTQPLLIVHGTQDALVPLAHATELFERAQSRDKNIVVLEGAGHNGLWGTGGQRDVFEFLSRF